MYQIKVNDGEALQIDRSGETYQINGQPVDWDICHLGGNRYHIIFKTHSYEAELTSYNAGNKQVMILINGEKYIASLKDKMDLLLEKMGIDNLKSTKLKEMKAPMPGLILSIEVSEGDKVKKGDAIMILEAMKMENVLKSPGDAIVRSINVTQGDSVDKNQVLINF